MVAIIQMSITLGAVVGGALFDLSGYQMTFATSAALLLIAALLAALTSRNVPLGLANNRSQAKDIAIQESRDGKAVHWMEKVSDEQYRK